MQGSAYSLQARLLERTQSRFTPCGTSSPSRTSRSITRGALPGRSCGTNSITIPILIPTKGGQCNRGLRYREGETKLLLYRRLETTGVAAR